MIYPDVIWPYIFLILLSIQIKCIVKWWKRSSFTTCPSDAVVKLSLSLANWRWPVRVFLCKRLMTGSEMIYSEVPWSHIFCLAALFSSWCKAGRAVQLWDLTVDFWMHSCGVACVDFEHIAALVMKLFIVFPEGWTEQVNWTSIGDLLRIFLTT